MSDWRIASGDPATSSHTLSPSPSSSSSFSSPAHPSSHTPQTTSPFSSPRPSSTPSTQSRPSSTIPSSSSTTTASIFPQHHTTTLSTAKPPSASPAHTSPPSLTPIPTSLPPSHSSPAVTQPRSIQVRVQSLLKEINDSEQDCVSSLQNLRFPESYNRLQQRYQTAKLLSDDQKAEGEKGSTKKPQSSCGGAAMIEFPSEVVWKKK